jgi:phage terminase large subunit
MTRVINPNLRFLHECAFKKKKRGAVLEGSSRSSKTWGGVDFLVLLCAKFEHKATINIVKETFNSFKTTLYEDFNRRLPDFGIRSPFNDKENVARFKLFGNRINLLGADSDSVLHGASSDYFFINESLDVDNSVFDQLEQRCRKFWWMDYNPKVTEHWVYNKVCSRDDVGFLKTTFLDNPYLSIHEKNKILSYQPVSSTTIANHFVFDHKLSIEDGAAKAKKYDSKLNLLNFKSLALEELERSKKNESQGTADDFMWNVYGLGLRSAPEGVVFQHVTWIKEFPKNIEKIYYGSDIGFTVDPSTIVKVGVSGQNLYLEKLFCAPTLSPTDYVNAIANHVAKETVWADSSQPGYIADARRAGHLVLGVSKFKGSIDYGIALLKKFKIHIVDCPEWRKEQSNYKYRVVNGVKLDDPVDAHNHLWDAARYAALSHLRTA